MSQSPDLRRRIVVAYDEIALKRGSRSYFEKRLKINIAKQLGIGNGQVIKRRGRLVVELSPEQDFDKPLQQLQRVFGLRRCHPAYSVELSFEAMLERGLALAQEELARGQKTFKVRARRNQKRFAMKSQEINREMGAKLLQALPELSVDVRNPDFELGVEIFGREAYVYSQAVPCLGGLPVGSCGKAVALLSGGIDSPVAAWLGQKRGLHVDCAYFHSFPFTGEKTKDKVMDLAQVLARTSPNPLHFHVYSVTEIQKQIQAHCAESYWTLMLRRFMVRIAEKMAWQFGHKALIMGDSVGQVASQTLMNLNCMDDLGPYVILRPLICHDKYEIVNQARDIGTYDISIRPHQDCCTLFAPPNPITRGRLYQCLRDEEKLDVSALIADALRSVEVYRLDGQNCSRLEVPQEVILGESARFPPGTPRTVASPESSSQTPSAAQESEP